ncbi:hypothetical protein C7974DRAFT_440557 [Boeremia exigua]|uniref:uncharacterized protein n=1 Tax=Boeremia exigua TaxID=749465 RepID=UPI001E8E42BD|nr:uncharacterized protein C7974DRAFT_440557 [Boeremia exigua]KAH6644892.1 hypothetical protein C7974DRAFT_440557 [Boeremia exigua]
MSGGRMQSTLFYIKEFDVIGLTILATGLSLLYLSFSIYSYHDEGWQSPMVLMVVAQGHTPALLAVESVILDVGKSAGSAIGTAIWTDMFPKKLANYLPSSDISRLNDIHGSINVQSSYPVGSLARNAIEHAYLDTQRTIFYFCCSSVSYNLGFGAFLEGY